MSDKYSFYIRPLLLDDIDVYLAHHERCYSSSQLYLAEKRSMPTAEEIRSTVSDPYPESLLLIAVPSTDPAAIRATEERDPSTTLHYVEHSLAQADEARSHSGSTSAKDQPTDRLPAILGHGVVLPYDLGMLRDSMAHAAKVTVVLPGISYLEPKTYDAVEQALYRELVKRSKARKWPYETFITRMPFREGEDELVMAFDGCIDAGFLLVGREKGIVVKEGKRLDIVTFQA